MFKFKEKKVSERNSEVVLAWEVTASKNNTGSCTTNNNASGCGC